MEFEDLVYHPWREGGIQFEIAGSEAASVRQITHVMTAAGREVRRLSTTPAGRATLNPSWSPDGGKLVVASTRDDDAIQWGLYVLSPDIGSIVPLTNDRTPYGYGHPRWSPGGRLLVFHSNRDGAKQTTRAELYVIGSDGTGMRRLTNNHEYDGFADW